MAQRPTLPVKVEAAIEREKEQISIHGRDTYYLLFDPPINLEGLFAGRISAQINRPPVFRKPAQLKEQLIEYSTTLFDAEARQYLGHARNESELKAWLTDLAACIQAEVAAEVSARNADFNCHPDDRWVAIGNVLKTRVEHWISSRRHQPKSMLLQVPKAIDSPDSPERPTPMQIIDRFRDINGGCSLEDLAEKAGVDRRQVFRIRNGKPVRRIARTAVADLLQVDPSLLLPKS